MKILNYLFILFFLSSCGNVDNKIFFRAKSKKIVDVQYVKEVDYVIDLEGYSLNKNEIDSLIIDIFKKKNINLVENETRYKLEIYKFDYSVKKKRDEVMDNKGFGTGQYGIQLNIQFDVESRIIDTLAKKEKIIKSIHGDIKPVHSDFLFDFFAVDSEDNFKPIKPINSSFNMISHKVVKFLNSQNK